MNICFVPKDRPDLPAYYVIGCGVEVVGDDGTVWNTYTYASTVSALVAAAHDMERHGVSVQWVPKVA